MTFKAPPVFAALSFAVLAFSAILVPHSTEADPGGCLKLEMAGKETGTFHNRCGVGIFVIWNDEGICRPRNSMDWYPCSHWVPEFGTAGTGPELAGRVTWAACEEDYPRETGSGGAVCENSGREAGITQVRKPR